MLSNTDDRKPSPSVVGHDGGGSLSTGISEAHQTSASRKMLPLSAPGSRLHCGARTGAVARIASTTALPITGKWSSTAGSLRLNQTLAEIAAARIASTTPSRVTST